MATVVGIVCVCQLMLLFANTRFRKKSFDNFVESVQIVFHSLINKATRLRGAVYTWSFRLAFFTILMATYVAFSAYK